MYIGQHTSVNLMSGVHAGGHLSKLKNARNCTHLYRTKCLKTNTPTFTIRTGEQCKETLRATIDDINLMKRHSMDHLFAFLQLTFGTLDKSRLPT